MSVNNEVQAALNHTVTTTYGERLNLPVTEPAQQEWLDFLTSLEATPLTTEEIKERLMTFAQQLTAEALESQEIVSILVAAESMAEAVSIWRVVRFIIVNNLTALQAFVQGFDDEAGLVEDTHRYFMELIKSQEFSNVIATTFVLIDPELIGAMRKEPYQSEFKEFADRTAKDPVNYPTRFASATTEDVSSFHQFATKLASAIFKTKIFFNSRQDFFKILAEEVEQALKR